MTQRILVPLDGSRFGEHALPIAISLAQRSGAALELATVAMPETPVNQAPEGTGVRGDDSRDRGRARASAYLEEVSSRIREAGYGGALSSEVISAGNTAHSIVRHVVEGEIGLVVMTTHGRGPLQRAWLGSTTDGVIRRSPCPVLLIRPDAENDGSKDEAFVDLTTFSTRFGKVLIPLDGSKAAEELLRIAPAIADPEAHFTLLRVVAPLVAGGSPYLPHVVAEARDEEGIRRAAREYLEGVAADFGLEGREVRIETRLQGQAGMAILQVAEKEEMDLIAMSTTGRGGVSRLLLGSVADKVIRGAPCPILIYRKPEEE